MLNKRNFIIILIFIMTFILFATIIIPKEEGFTPKIRETYRPYVRSVRNIMTTLMQQYDPTFYGKKTLIKLGVW
jgi:ATP/ADP translocase